MGWASWTYIEWWGWVSMAAMYVAGITAIRNFRNLLQLVPV
jgi:hypothetical protein